MACQRTRGSSRVLLALLVLTALDTAMLSVAAPLAHACNPAKEWCVTKGTPGQPEGRGPGGHGGDGDPSGDGGSGGGGNGNPPACLVLGTCADDCAGANGGPCEAGPGVPPLTPGDLARRAWAKLRPPVPDVHTAPPRGHDSLVGLPLWIWVPEGQWQPIKVRDSDGPVWVEITATPKKIVINPGAGLTSVECGGPGTPYDPSRSGDQQPDCSVTFERSSAVVSGGAYKVTVSVVWGGTWVGSGGESGTFEDLTVSTSFPVRVAEGQSVN